jgi:hypothetical protein
MRPETVLAYAVTNAEDDKSTKVRPRTIVKVDVTCGTA